MKTEAERARQAEIEKLFHAARELPQAEWAVFVERNCQVASVREEVLSLLQQRSGPVGPILRIAGDIPAQVEDLTGTILDDRYKFVQRLGAGGMGQVYLARDLRLKKLVALKRVNPDLSGDREYKQRLEREAREAFELQGEPNIAWLFNIFDSEGETFLVMEYVEGSNLRERVRRPIQVRDFMVIASQCLDGLCSAHAKRIHHRDIKPENIMLRPDGRVKICDFGLAKRLSSDAGRVVEPDEVSTVDDDETRSTGVAGTAAYMAPEVFGDDSTDERADLFSLGVVFFELLAKYNPFVGADFIETRQKLLKEHPPPLREINPRVPAALDRIIRKMLAKNPADRFQSAKEVKKAFDRFRVLERSKRLAAAAVAVLAVATSVYAYFLAGADPEPLQILVGDFENQTGQPYVDLAVRDWLTTGLQRSPRIKVVAMSRVAEVLERMRMPGDSRLDEDLARELALRDNVGVIVTGAVAASGSGFQIVARALDPRTDIALVTATTTAGSSNALLGAVEELASLLQVGLGESGLHFQNQKPLAEVTSGQYEAVVRYSRARELRRKGDIDGARALFQAALDIDPEFAAAYQHLANAQLTLGRHGEAKLSMARAYELRDRVGEAEALSIAGDYHVHRTEYELAADQYRVLASLYPDDIVGNSHLAFAGQLSRDVGIQEQALRRLLTLDPEGIGRWANLVGFLARQNREDEALQVREEAREFHPDAPRLMWDEGLSWLGMNEISKAQSAFDSLALAGGILTNAGRLYQVQTLIYSGRLDQAAEQLETDLASGFPETSAFTQRRRYWLARVYAMTGRRAEALSQLELLDDHLSMPLRLYELRDAGRMYAELGEVVDAERIASELDLLAEEYPGKATRAAAAQVLGEIEVAMGNYDPAEQRLQTAYSLWADPSSLWSLANLAYRQGDYARALELYGDLLNRRGEILDEEFSGLWVLAHLRSARCNRNLGNYGDALRFYNQFLDLWGDAPGIASMLADVQREMSDLE